MRDRLISGRLPRALAAAGAVAARARGLLPQRRARSEQCRRRAPWTGPSSSQTVPITKRPGKSPAVVLSLGPGQLPALAVGDTLRASAELQVSTTCVEKLPRCIGKPYSYNPAFTAQIVVATSEGATAGAGVLPLSPPVQMGCGQKRPNRNHHCVLTIPTVVRPIASPTRFRARPAPASSISSSRRTTRTRRPATCSSSATTSPMERVKGGRGRLNAIVTAPGRTRSRSPSTRRIASRGRSRSAPSARASRRSPTRSRLDGLEPGDVVSANALQHTGVGLAGRARVRGRPDHPHHEADLHPAEEEVLDPGRPAHARQRLQLHPGTEPLPDALQLLQGRAGDDHEAAGRQLRSAEARSTSTSSPAPSRRSPRRRARTR